MSTLARILFPLLLTAPALAQEGSAPAAQAAAEAKPAAHADDACTAKDPAIVALDAFIAGAGKPGEGPGWKTHLKKPPLVAFDPGSDYFWHIQTNQGELTVKFLPEVAPMHVSSTIYLARTGFYDDLTFHRVIKGFMAQGGCPLGRGTGGPGYTYDGEFKPEVKHDRPGLLSMANTGQPTSDGSQFFLTFVPTPHLNGKHTIFGAVVGEDGMKTLRALEQRGSQGGQTTEPLLMERTWITVAPKEAAGATKPAEAGATGGEEK